MEEKRYITAEQIMELARLNSKAGYDKSIEDINKLIDEIPNIGDDVGTGCNNEEEKIKFRAGYRNGRSVLKGELRELLRKEQKD